LGLFLGVFGFFVGFICFLAGVFWRLRGALFFSGGFCGIYFFSGGSGEAVFFPVEAIVKKKPS
jgi:hypothetical protein